MSDEIVYGLENTTFIKTDANKDSIIIKDGSFGWESIPILSNINFVLIINKFK